MLALILNSLKILKSFALFIYSLYLSYGCSRLRIASTSGSRTPQQTPICRGLKPRAAIDIPSGHRCSYPFHENSLGMRISSCGGSPDGNSTFQHVRSLLTKSRDMSSTRHIRNGRWEWLMSQPGQLGGLTPLKSGSRRQIPGYPVTPAFARGGCYHRSLARCSGPRTNSRKNPEITSIRLIMDTEDPSTAAAKSLGSRVSVACLPCRNRHVRCDAQQPVCIRCSSEGRTCQYVKSRRGGLTRTRLAERRQARANNGPVTRSPSTTSPESGSPGRGVGQEYQAPADGFLRSPLEYRVRCTTESENGHSDETPESIFDIQFTNIETDFLIKSYYKHFHRCHPCVLPQRRFQQHYDRAPEKEILSLLVAVMRFIGSLYSCPEVTSQLQEKVKEGFQAAQRLTPDPFLAQCHILYSISLYWSAEKDRAREQIDAAIKIALDLGMNRSRFASEQGCGDAVLQESFRRTFWQIYCIDAYYAAIKRSPTFPLCEVEADTDLPCEEDEYESGVSRESPFQTTQAC